MKGEIRLEDIPRIGKEINVRKCKKQQNILGSRFEREFLFLADNANVIKNDIVNSRKEKERKQKKGPFNSPIPIVLRQSFENKDDPDGPSNVDFQSKRRILRATPPPVVLEKIQFENEPEEKKKESSKEHYKQIHKVKVLCDEKKNEIFEKARKLQVDSQLSQRIESRRLREMGKRESNQHESNLKYNFLERKVLHPQIFSVQPVVPELKRKTETAPQYKSINENLSSEKKRKMCNNIKNANERLLTLSEIKLIASTHDSKNSRPNTEKDHKTERNNSKFGSNNKSFIFGGIILFAASVSLLFIKKSSTRK